MDIIAWLLLTAGALLPALLIVAWAYYRDRLPEPPPVVIKTLLLGCVITVPILIVEIILGVILGIEFEFGMQSFIDALLVSFVIAALTEESFKFCVLHFYSARQSAFDEVFDGIVYGVAASLGFALIENVMYVLTAAADGGMDQGILVIIVRALTAVPMHASCGVIMGACIGFSKIRKKPSWAVAGLLLAIFLHGVYDTFVFSMELPGLEDVVLGLLALGFIGTTIAGVVISILLVIILRKKQLA